MVILPLLTANNRLIAVSVYLPHERYMALEEIDFVTIQKRVAGSYLVTIPAPAIKALGIKDSERMKVYLDRENSRVVFELQAGKKK